MAIGGGLGAILAGLSGVAEASQRAKEQQVKQMEAQQRLAAFQDYFKRQKDEQESEKGYLDAIRGGLGGGDLSGLSGVSGTGLAPVGMSSPDVTASTSASAAPASSYTPSKGRGFDIAGLYDLAVKGGFKPGQEAATQAAVSMGESSGNPGAHNTAGEDSVGLNQINRRAWGMDVPLDPLGNMKFAHNIYSQQGWQPWSVYKSGAYKQFLPEAMAVAQRYGGAMPNGDDASPLRRQYETSLTRYGQTEGKYGPGFYNSEQGQGRRPKPESFEEYKRRMGDGGAEPLKINALRMTDGEGSTGPDQPPTGAGGDDAAGPIAAPPEVQKEGQQAFVKTVQAIPPEARGRMSGQSLLEAIERANPGMSAHAKFLALEKAQKLMAPIEQEKMRQRAEAAREAAAAERQKNLFQQQDLSQDRRFKQGEAATTQRMILQEKLAAERDQEKFVTPEGDVKYLRKGSDIPKGWKPWTAGAAGIKASNNIEVTDKDGKITFSGAAHQTPEGWVSDKDNKLIEAGEGDIKILGRGTQGRQAAAQIQSMIGASSELVGEARNLMELPSTATAGIFQGVQGVPASELGNALRRTLANKLTPEEATDLKTSFQGVSRSLATIEAQGRATGLVGLTGMSEQLMPQTGDSQGNILRKMATLRQIMERNIDAIAASPNATREQKEFLKTLRTEMEQVVPFTVHDVNALQHGDKESVAKAARKFGLGGGPGGAEGGAAYASPADIMRAVDSGKLSEEQAKKLLIERFGYSQ